jgi:hypothetical protein
LGGCLIMAKRYYTPAEVNRIIPDLESITGQLRTLEAELQVKERELSHAKVKISQSAEPHNDLTFLREEAEIDFLRILARTLFSRVHELGGEVKQGFLVDFVGLIDGQEVLLCWKPGEANVSWFHGLQEGMSSRKPIPES